MWKILFKQFELIKLKKKNKIYQNHWCNFYLLSADKVRQSEEQRWVRGRPG